MESGFLLDVVVGKSAAVLELLARKDKALLVRRDALLVLDLALDHVDRVRRLNLKCDRLPCQRFHKDLHVASGVAVVESCGVGRGRDVLRFDLVCVELPSCFVLRFCFCA